MIKIADEYWECVPVCIVCPNVHPVYVQVFTCTRVKWNKHRFFFYLPLFAIFDNIYPPYFLISPSDVCTDPNKQFQ